MRMGEKRRRRLKRRRVNKQIFILIWVLILVGCVDFMWNYEMEGYNLVANISYCWWNGKLWLAEMQNLLRCSEAIKYLVSLYESGLINTIYQSIVEHNIRTAL